MQQTGSNLDNEMSSTVKKIKKKSARNELQEMSATNIGGVDPNSEQVTKKKKKKKSARSENETMTSNNDMNYEDSQQEPKNRFDSIWNADSINGKNGNNQNLGSIPEQPRIVRTKSYLGGKVAKLDEEHISNLSNVQDANVPITYKKSRGAKDMNSNDDAHLVDEFNKAQSSSSSMGH